MSSSKISPFQPKLDANECYFCLPQLRACDPINFVNAHCSRACFKCKECALIKLIGLLLTTMVSPNGIYSALVEAEKGKLWALTLPHKMCPRKQTTEPKLLILVSFFSGEVPSYTDTSYCIHILWEVSRSVFFWATLYICLIPFKLHNMIHINRLYR